MRANYSRKVMVEGKGFDQSHLLINSSVFRERYPRQNGHTVQDGRKYAHGEFRQDVGVRGGSSGSLLPELLGKPDENSFGAPDVAEPIRVFVLDHFADKLSAAFAEPGERIVDVLHGEHDA